MELKKKPLDVDFVVDPRPLTKKEKLAISEFIKADKAKRARRKNGQQYLKRQQKRTRLHDKARTALNTYAS